MLFLFVQAFSEQYFADSCFWAVLVIKILSLVDCSDYCFFLGCGVEGNYVLNNYKLSEEVGLPAVSAPLNVLVGWEWRA